ncbi:PQQ-binding-like beta-propeller repeat protein [Actinomadura sp. B10D3]|uniref:protein kinase domain-containing protein n=1 Tax=Actinomadura sp. B10D3 TaxID=3153557 RepID=UPI00325EAC20
MQPLTADDPGTMGAYRVVARLGAGGMGRVYLARSPGRRWVALKVIRPEFTGDSEFRARFRREVAAARMVSGAFTTPVLDADTVGPVPWLATAYVPGPSLQEAIDAYGPMTEAGVRALGMGLAEALLAVHDAGLVHRDLKPSNVLLTAGGPRVIDFGISRVLDGTAVTRTGSAVGTPAYMSPEHVSGELSAASDVFSLGGLLVFAATGRGPFGGGPADALLYRVVRSEPSLDGVPPALLPVVSACLAKEPAGRPRPRDLLDMLEPGPSADAASWLSAGIRADLALRERRLADLEASPPAPSLDSQTGTETRPSAKTGMGRRRAITLAGGTAALFLGGAGTAAWRVGTSGRDSETAKAPGSLVGERKGPAPVWTHRPDRPSQFAQLVLGKQYVYLAGAELEAIDPSTGRRKWSVELSPAGMVLSGSQIYASPPDHRLQVLDAVKGRTQHQIKSTELYSAFQDKAGRIIGGAGGLLVVSSGEFVAAFDIRTGRMAWKKDIAAAEERIVVGEGTCYVRTETDLYALALNDGRESWRTPLTAATGTPSLALSARSLYTSTAEGAVTYDLAGRRLWATKLEEHAKFAAHAYAAVGEGTAFYFSGEDVFALDSATGTPRWHTRAPAPVVSYQDLGQGPVASSAVVAAVFDGQRTSTGFCVLDARTGAVRWNLQTPGDRSTRWTLQADAKSVFAFDGAHLYAFRG